MKAFLAIIATLACLNTIPLWGDDFYEISDVRYYHIAPDREPAVFKSVDQVDNNNHKVTKKVFVPCIKVRVSVKEQVNTHSIFAHAYFYDQNKTLIGKSLSPSIVDWGSNHKYDWPEILPKDHEQIIFFGLPDNVLGQENWSVVVVFGDTKGVDAQIFSEAPEPPELADYDYPEKNALEDKNGPPIERKPAMDPLIEHVVQTGNPQQPQITLFMRPPLGMTDASEAKGVLCMSLLAGSIDGVKRQLQGYEGGESLNGILKFAENHKLIIVCWGSHGLWDPRKSWDDQPVDVTWNTDKAFDQVAEAWENGVQYFIKEYGIPQNGYLLWGVSGSAQYACRLALRKPDYFLAIHAHIPSSFDKPTPEGNKILWCLTTGEKEIGHTRSLRFYEQCRNLGYPMIYKAVIGLGHAESPISDNLGLKFFDYALHLGDQRQTYDQQLANPLLQSQVLQLQPWPESFRKPSFIGDIVNQDVVPYDQMDLVPDLFRVPLPTKDIADAWNR